MCIIYSPKKVKETIINWIGWWYRWYTTGTNLGVVHPAPMLILVADVIAFFKIANVHRSNQVPLTVARRAGKNISRYARRPSTAVGKFKIYLSSNSNDFAA